MASIPDGLTASYSVIVYPGKELPEQYLNMVLSKWMRSLKYGNDYFKLIDSKCYYEVYEKYIKTLLNRTNSMVRLAVLSDDRDVVLGWSLMEKESLHYVHVTNEYRNNGIARLLVPGKIHKITHLTKAGMSLWHSKAPHAIFDPFNIGE